MPVAKLKDNIIDLKYNSQISSIDQIRTIGMILYYAKLRYMDEGYSLKEILESKDRNNAGTTINPRGLIFLGPSYENITKKYQTNRKNAYPEIGDQLDMLWHSIDEDPALKQKYFKFYEAIKAVKAKYPK